ncbi:hypothetical protein ACJX0J_030218, partial [Zea mays]
FVFQGREIKSFIPLWLLMNIHTTIMKASLVNELNVTIRISYIQKLLHRYNFYVVVTKFMHNPGKEHLNMNDMFHAKTKHIDGQYYSICDIGRFTIYTLMRAEREDG